MSRKFIAKKRKNISVLFKIVIIFIIILFILLKILQFKIFDTNTTLVTYIMESSNHLIDTNLSYSDKLTGLSLLITNLDLKKPATLFQNDYVYEANKDETTKTSENVEESIYKPLSFFKNMVKNFTSVVKPVVNLHEEHPLVYIYNTHQTEEYLDPNTAIPNTTSNVYSAANTLKELLEKKNIKTIVEEGNISAYLEANGLNYDDSYIASRYYLEQALTKYPSVKIFIDLHRDALSHDLSTVEHDGKNYAKVLFVVGLEHKNYQQNLDFANEINDLIKINHAYLTRGILTKMGPLVNGIYNQDLNNNIILLEVGGNESTFDEVCNTLEIISNILYKKLGDNNV